jgi:hypothetical protein
MGESSNVVSLGSKRPYESPNVRDLGVTDEMSIARIDEVRRVQLDEFVAEVTGA